MRRYSNAAVFDSYLRGSRQEWYDLFHFSHQHYFHGYPCFRQYVPLRSEELKVQKACLRALFLLVLLK